MRRNGPSRGREHSSYTGQHRTWLEDTASRGRCYSSYTGPTEAAGRGLGRGVAEAAKGLAEAAARERGPAGAAATVAARADGGHRQRDADLAEAAGTGLAGAAQNDKGLAEVADRKHGPQLEDTGQSRGHRAGLSVRPNRGSSHS